MTVFIGVILYVKDKTFIKKNRKKYNFLSTESDFTNSLIQLIAAVIKVDKKHTDHELRFVEKALKNHFSEAKLMRLMNQIKFNLEKEVVPIVGICRLIRAEFELPAKLQLMHLLIGICAADGVLSKTEDALLKKIAVEIRLPFATFNIVLNMFRFRHEGQEYKRAKKSTPSVSLVKSAYAVLGLTENADETEIKKAYRKLAVKHHPDKVAHLGEEIQSAANDQFLIISEAYELIKLKKGFS